MAIALCPIHESADAAIASARALTVAELAAGSDELPHGVDEWGAAYVGQIDVFSASFVVAGRSSPLTYDEYVSAVGG